MASKLFGRLSSLRQELIHLPLNFCCKDKDGRDASFLIFFFSVDVAFCLHGSESERP